MLLAARRRGPRPGSIRHELDARRAEFCHNLLSAPTYADGERDPWFCSLGSLGCTAAHGEEYERPWYVVNVLGRPWEGDA